MNKFIVALILLSIIPAFAQKVKRAITRSEAIEIAREIALDSPGWVSEDIEFIGSYFDEKSQRWALNVERVPETVNGYKVYELHGGIKIILSSTGERLE